MHLLNTTKCFSTLYYLRPKLNNVINIDVRCLRQICSSIDVIILYNNKVILERFYRKLTTFYNAYTYNYLVSGISYDWSKRMVYSKNI